jgi:hypothetical protein
LMCMVQLYILHLKDGMHIFRYLELFLLIHWDALLSFRQVCMQFFFNHVLIF